MHNSCARKIYERIVNVQRVGDDSSSPAGVQLDFLLRDRVEPRSCYSCGSHVKFGMPCSTDDDALRVIVPCNIFLLSDCLVLVMMPYTRYTTGVACQLIKSISDTGCAFAVPSFCKLGVSGGNSGPSPIMGVVVELLSRLASQRTQSIRNILYPCGVFFTARTYRFLLYDLVWGTSRCT